MEVLGGAEATPIAQLRPGIDGAQSRAVDGVVTITWPYSAVTKSIAFVLAERDFRLRRDRGQLRVEFHGAAGRALADSGIGGGDEIRIGLDGAQWERREAPTRLPGGTIEWQLKFTNRLLLKMCRVEAQGPEIIDLDAPAGEDAPQPALEDAPADRSTPPPPEPRLLDGDATPAAMPTASALPAKRQASMVLGPEEYASPAFLKRARVSYGSLFEGGLDIFDEEKGKKGKNRRRSRFSMNNRAWKYSSRSPSPEANIPSDRDSDLGDALRENAEAQAATGTPKASPPRPAMVDEGCQTQELYFSPSMNVQVSAESRLAGPPAQASPLGARDEGDHGDLQTPSRALFGHRSSDEMPSLGAEPNMGYEVEPQNHGFGLETGPHSDPSANASRARPAANTATSTVAFVDGIAAADYPMTTFGSSDLATTSTIDPSLQFLGGIAVPNHVYYDAPQPDNMTWHSEPHSSEFPSEPAQGAAQHPMDMVGDSSPAARQLSSVGSGSASLDGSAGNDRRSTNQAEGASRELSSQQAEEAAPMGRDDAPDQDYPDDGDTPGEDYDLRNYDRARYDDEAVSDEDSQHGGSDDGQQFVNLAEEDYESNEAGSGEELSGSGAPPYAPEGVGYGWPEYDYEGDDYSDSEGDSEEEGYGDGFAAATFATRAGAPALSAPQEPVFISLLSDSEDEDKGQDERRPDAGELRPDEAWRQMDEGSRPDERRQGPRQEEPRQEEPRQDELEHEDSRLGETASDEPQHDEERRPDETASDMARQPSGPSLLYPEAPAERAKVADSQSDETWAKSGLNVGDSDETSGQDVEGVGHAGSVSSGVPSEPVALAVSEAADNGKANGEASPAVGSGMEDVQQTEAQQAEAEDQHEDTDAGAETQVATSAVDSRPADVTDVDEAQGQRASSVDIEVQPQPEHADAVVRDGSVDESAERAPKDKDMYVEDSGRQAAGEEAAEGVKQGDSVGTSDVLMQDAPQDGPAEERGLDQGSEMSITAAVPETQEAHVPEPESHQEASEVMAVTETVEATDGEGHQEGAEVAETVTAVAAEGSQQLSRAGEAEAEEDASGTMLEAEKHRSEDDDFAVETQIIREFQEYRSPGKQTTGGDRLGSARDQGQAKDDGKAEVLITVKSLRSRSHRKTGAADASGSPREDPSVALAKAAAEAHEAEQDKGPKSPATRLRVAGSRRGQADPSLELAKAAASSEAGGSREEDGPTTPRVTRSMGMAEQTSPSSTRSTRSKAHEEAAEGAVKSAAGEEEAGQMRFQLQKTLRTTLPDVVALRSLRMSLNKRVDVMGVCAATPAAAHRPKHGPRDYMLEVLLTDPSTSGVSVAHMFRPHQASLPAVQAGDVVLLRRMLVVSVRGRGFGARAGEGSAWAVFEGGDAEMVPQIRGPPVEVSGGEAAYAAGLRRWWGLRDERARARVERASQRAMQAGRNG